MDNTNKIVIGIDLGGTNVRVGAVTSQGQITAWQDAAIEAAKGADAGVEKISDLINQIQSAANLPLAAIGIGSTGPLDRRKGFIQNPYTLPGWENVDIISPLANRFGVPVALENDADAAALGESWMGAGRGAQRLAMVTIGTGVGSALVLNGEIYRGIREEHPEGGHQLIDPSGPLCYCGAHGCWESLVAGPAIVAYARQVAQEGEGFLQEKMRGSLQEISASLVFEGARLGDPLCLGIVERTTGYIGLGLVNLIMLYLPDCIVLTGGVMRSFDLMEARIRDIIHRHAIVVPADEVNIQLAQLGQHAGLTGAARAAYNLLSE